MHLIIGFLSLPFKVFYRNFESIVSYMCIYSIHIQYIFSGRVLYMGMHYLAFPYFLSEPNGKK